MAHPDRQSGDEIPEVRTILIRRVQDAVRIVVIDRPRCCARHRQDAIVRAGTAPGDIDVDTVRRDIPPASLTPGRLIPLGNIPACRAWGTGVDLQEDAGRGRWVRGASCEDIDIPVSYTHLTLPTSDLV